MRLSWNEIRSRAAAFAREWADAAYEKGETQSFYNDFFAIFGVRRRTVARYEEHVRRLDDTHGFIDLFWPGVLLVEQKSAGRGLAAARGQAGAYFDALPERDRPRYQLLCDFQTFELLDRDEREESRFALADLPAHVERFGFILGVQRRAFRDQDPYVNGDLFAEPLRIPDFDAGMRRALLDAGRFDWTAISPAIFGALFQSVMEPAERRAAGAHYTTEKNILKVIEPLFLDDLRAEFAQLKARRDSRVVPDLHRFQQKLGGLRFFDPACGCGNFLIIAYRELRALEIEVLRALNPDRRQFEMLAEVLSVVEVDQVHGIEVGEFPARIAATALWHEPVRARDPRRG